jgi:hypothetical protein
LKIFKFSKRNSRDTSTTNEEARPTLLRNLKNLEVKSGSFVRLDLFVSGQPQPDVNFTAFFLLFKCIFENNKNLNSDTVVSKRSANTIR